MSMSRRAGLFAAVCSAGLIASIAVPAGAETLADAIALAYQTNPSLREQRANLRALDESEVQARAGFRPTASVSGSAGWSRSDYGSPQSASIFSPAIKNQEATSASATVTVGQPLYTGGRVNAQISAAQAQIEAGREGLRSAEASILGSVIEAYVGVRRDMQALDIANENVTVLQRQLDEAKARFDVGEITRTDVAQAEARLAAARASQSTAQAQLAITRASYAAVVGQNPTDLEDAPTLADLLPKTVDDAFDAAEQSNPQLLSAIYTERVSRARVVEAKAAKRPTVDLQGTLGYTGGNVGDVSPFVDYDRSIRAGVGFSMPLYSGGVISSQVRAAQEQNNADAAAIESARRQALQSVSQAWNQLLGSRANLISSEEQVRASKIAFEGVRQEYQVGLRTTLDVLNAQQELRSAELSLINARRDEYVASSLVLSAVGRLNAETLIPQIARYDPVRNRNDVVHSSTLPWEPVVGTLDRIGAPIRHKAPPEAKGK